MRAFSIEVSIDLNIRYNHYLSNEFIDEYYEVIKLEWFYPSWYFSRKFDKPAIKYRNGSLSWHLDNKYHRVVGPSVIYPDGSVLYHNNGLLLMDVVVIERQGNKTEIV